MDQEQPVEKQQSGHHPSADDAPASSNAPDSPDFKDGIWKVKTTYRTKRHNSIGYGSTGSVVVSPCGTRITKTARAGYSEYVHRQNMRNVLRECDVYMHLPPHPRLVPFHSFTATPASASITLGYRKNGNLQDYLVEHPDQTLLRRMLWCVEATEGLAHLHRHGVVHCDLRPDNFLVDDDRKLCIIDFGGSHLTGDKPLVAEADGYFMPRGPDWATSPTTDRFALGSCFYYIMTGHAPHHDLADKDAITPAFARKEYPKDVHGLLIADVILKCWQGEFERTVDVYYDLAKFGDQFRPEVKVKSAESAMSETDKPQARTEYRGEENSEQPGESTKDTGEKEVEAAQFH